jgi:TPR repeat protein/tRNA A-37 threonylcarbamoyl transferase component Bud32
VSNPPRDLATDPTVAPPVASSDDTWAAPAGTLSAPDAADAFGAPRDPEGLAVHGELARGGMGRVLRARDRCLRREVAIKELITADPLRQERFEREVLITARLQHPAIVRVYAAGRWPDGRAFYEMELVAGRPLDEVVARARTLPERLALIPSLLTVVEALAYAHGQRIIHRDLKPSNVMLGNFGQVVVIDWGLAKDLAAAPESTDQTPVRLRAGASSETEAGAVLGTPSYMPPEQAAGRPATERSDVYSLGAMLYHVLTGVQPFAAQTGAETVAAVLAGPPTPLRRKVGDLPAELYAIVDKAMARNPAGRYPTAREMADDLRRFQTGQLVGSHRYTLGELARRFVRRHLAAIAVGALAAVAIAITGVYAFVKVVQARRRAEGSLAQLQEEEGARIMQTAKAQRDVGFTFNHHVTADPALDLPRAFDLESQSCAHDNPGGCADLGTLYELGWGVAKDQQEALTLYEQSCNGGDGVGCTNLGRFYSQGLGVTASQTTAAQLFEKACEVDGTAAACTNLGGLYDQGQGVAQDPAKAHSLYEKACQQGDTDGCYDLGVVYEHGESVEQDYAKARDLYSLACDGGQAQACGNLGYLYLNGNGVTQDDEEAQLLCEKGCDGGDLTSCNVLGNLTSDPKKAVALYQKACDGDLWDACSNLGGAYWRGEGVAPDIAQARALFTKSCTTGNDVYGCMNLAELAHAQGEPEDPAKVEPLFAQACAAGDTDGCKDLGDLCRGGDQHACTAAASQPAGP